jgi:hypothetical protein
MNESPAGALPGFFIMPSFADELFYQVENQRIMLS